MPSKAAHTARQAMQAILAGGGHALLLGLALPPVGVGLLALLAPAPLMALALRTHQPLRAGATAGLATLPLWLFEQSWVAGVTAVGYPLLALYLALYPALFVWIAAGAKRLGRWAWVGLALMWIGVEFLRGELAFTGYAWFLTAQPLIDAPLAGLARLAGVYGVGLIVALFAAMVAQAVAGAGKRRRALLIPAAPLLIAAVLAGAALRGGGEAETAGRSLRVGVVQTNVPQSNKQAWSGAQRRADFERFAQMTRALAQRTPTPDVIVWPETMFPGLTLDHAANEVERAAGLRFEDGTETAFFYDALLALQREINIPMLVGAIGVERRRVAAGENGGVALEQEAKFNSVYLLKEGSVAQARYDKLKLTPFGEVMPYLSWSDSLERWLLSIGAAGMAFDLNAGDAVVRFAIEASDGQPQPARIITPICFEITDASLIRRMVFANGERRAQAIVNLTNDGWFGASRAGRRQHLQLARWRALETATPVVRAANTGISAVIDARGRLMQVGPDQGEGPDRVAGTLLVDVPLPEPDGRTLFARLGDVVGWACLTATLGLTLLNLAPKRRRTGV